MCNTVWRCCCFASLTGVLLLYLLLLLLDVHIENIIDSYHERNLYEHCSSLIQQNVNDKHPFNEIHEVVTGDNYHYHYYEKKSNTFSYKLLQNTICSKIYSKMQHQTHYSLNKSHNNNNNNTDHKYHKERVHETYVCDEDEHNNTCNHCIYYQSSSTSLQWTKCQLVSIKEMQFNKTQNTNNVNTPHKLRSQTAEQLSQLKAEWSNYSQNLSEFANKMKSWSTDLPQRVLNIPSVRVNDSETSFVYIENETCVEGTNCRIKQHCVHYDSMWIKWEKCRQMMDYDENDKEVLYWNQWINVNIFTVILAALMIYIVNQCESETLSEKIIWKTRAYQCHSQYNTQSFCAICYENFRSSEQILLRCGHKFHEECLNQWEYIQNRRRFRTPHSWIQMLYVYMCRFKRNHKCPSCNRKYCVGNQKFMYQHEKYQDY